MTAILMSRRVIIAGLSLVAAVQITACGQTGDLVLPKRKPPASQVPVAPPPAPMPASTTEPAPTDADDPRQSKPSVPGSDR